MTIRAAELIVEVAPPEVLVFACIVRVILPVDLLALECLLGLKRPLGQDPARWLSEPFELSPPEALPLALSSPFLFSHAQALEIEAVTRGASSATS